MFMRRFGKKPIDVLLLGFLVLQVRCHEYPCKRFDPGENVEVDIFDVTGFTSFPVGTVMTFRCKTGYQLRGQRSLLCVESGWFGQPPKCEKTTCSRFDTGPPLRVDLFNDSSVTTFPHGTVITFSCDSGYLLGTTLSECVYGHWKGNVPTCKAFPDCPKPSLDFGYYVGGYYAGGKATFVCKDNSKYYLQGARASMCLLTGTWSDPWPTCQRRGCARFETESHLYVNEFHGTNASYFPDGTIITYGCETGYTLSGPSSSLCAEGVWIGRTQECRKQTCTRFSPEEHLHVKEFQVTKSSVFYEGTIIHYGCETGYVLFGPQSSLCTHGVWTDRTQACKRQNCGRFETEPPLYVNEFRAGNASEFPDGTFINYGCEPGYVLFGPRTSLCTRGVWLGRTQKCIQAKCGQLQAPRNGYIKTMNSTTLGVKATFRCNNGYKLEGSSERMCLEGKWNGTPARCQFIGTSGAVTRKFYGCPDPGHPDNGFVLTRGPFLAGHRAFFGCNEGYFMHGSGDIQCVGYVGGGGIPKWGIPIPKCKSPYYFDEVEEVRDEIQRLFNRKRQPYDFEFVYLAFDNLSTVGPENFRHVIGLARAITKKLFESHGRYKIGIVTFGTNVTFVVDPKENTSLDITLERLDRIPYTYGTAVPVDFIYGKSMVFRSPERFRRGDNRLFSILYVVSHEHKEGPGLGAEMYVNWNEYLRIAIRGDSDYPGVWSIGDLYVPGEHFALRDYNSMKLLAEAITHGQAKRDQ